MNSNVNLSSGSKLLDILVIRFRIKLSMAVASACRRHQKQWTSRHQQETTHGHQNRNKDSMRIFNARGSLLDMTPGAI